MAKWHERVIKMNGPLETLESLNSQLHLFHIEKNRGTAKSTQLQPQWTQSVVLLSYATYALPLLPRAGGLNQVIPDLSKQAKNNVNLEEECCTTRRMAKVRRMQILGSWKWLPMIPFRPELVSELWEWMDPRQTTEATNSTQKAHQKKQVHCFNTIFL